MKKSNTFGDLNMYILRSTLSVLSILEYKVTEFDILHIYEIQRFLYSCQDFFILINKILL
jgi:hypothetical protein